MTERIRWHFRRKCNKRHAKWTFALLAQRILFSRHGCVFKLS